MAQERTLLLLGAREEGHRWRLWIFVFEVYFENRLCLSWKEGLQEVALNF